MDYDIKIPCGEITNVQIDSGDIYPIECGNKYNEKEVLCRHCKDKLQLVSALEQARKEIDNLKRIG